VRARAGDLTAAGELAPAYALCFLPLSWSVELAARLAAAGHPHGHELGGWLADTLGPAVHRQLRETARSGMPLGAGAAQLLAALPAPPAHRTRIDVIGPMRLARDGVPADAPELRRARVRQLLGALVLHPVLTRDQAIALLWPGLDAAKAARNMRVTLTHLRRLLEPGRSGGEASYHLRTDGDTIRLVPSEFLSVDLWTLDVLDKQAGRARADGDTDRAAALLADAVELWRGDPLPDLLHVRSPDVLGEVEQVRIRHVGHLLALGELRLVADDATGSFALAERALSLEPFDARSHRLALAAALRGRRAAQITAARRRVWSALRQLGVPPDPPTAILLRQAARSTRAAGLVVGERQDGVLVRLDVFIREHLREVTAVGGCVVNLELRVRHALDVQRLPDALAGAGGEVVDAAAERQVVPALQPAGVPDPVSLAGNGDRETGVVDELDRHVLALPEDHGKVPLM
jgi:DNA-binding SARP family transcriptional activator